MVFIVAVLRDVCIKTATDDHLLLNFPLAMPFWCWTLLDNSIHMMNYLMIKLPTHLCGGRLNLFLLVFAII